MRKGELISRWQTVTDFEAVSLLGHPDRLAILRHLLAEPATLTQLAKAMDTYPARIRHHIKQLETADFIRLKTVKIAGSFVEKYYEATAQAFTVQLTLLPERPSTNTIILLGSHDLGVDLLAQQIREDPTTPDMYALPVGSLDGLIGLRQGIAHLAGCHLRDSSSGEYNQTHVRHLFPGEEMHLIALAMRQQGFIVQPRNPKGIKSLADLIREDVQFVNRKRGTGTRLWLDQQLAQQELPAQAINGYERTASTHIQVAEAVARGGADVGLGVLAAARRFGLDFVPLFEERYDLVLPEDTYSDPLLQPVLDRLQTAVFRHDLSQLEGYNAQTTGSEIQVD